MKIKMTKGSAIASFVIALVLILVFWLPNIAHGTLGFVAPVSGGALGYDLVPALAWLLFIYSCQNLFRNFPVAAKKAGIAAMVIGALIALAVRLDGGLVVGVIGCILFNPNILDKIRARRTSTASESEAPKTSDGIVPEVSVLPTSGKPADTRKSTKNTVRKLGREAVIFALLGQVLATVGGFIVLDSADRANARARAAEVAPPPGSYEYDLSAGVEGYDPNKYDKIAALAKKHGGTVEPGPGTRLVDERPYWAAYKDARSISGSLVGSLYMGLLGFPTGLGLWVFYRLVYFAIKG